jgi:hypothetical protein
MAGWRQAVELAMSDEAIVSLTAIARSRNEEACRVKQAQLLLRYRENACKKLSEFRNIITDSGNPGPGRGSVRRSTLVAGEDRSLYYTLMKHFTDLVEPNDMIEWWWGKDHYKGVDKLIASAELRRDHTLRETARRCETLAERPRKASDEIVDGEAVELPQAAE